LRGIFAKFSVFSRKNVQTPEKIPIIETMVRKNIIATIGASLIAAVLLPSTSKAQSSEASPWKASAGILLPTGGGSPALTLNSTYKLEGASSTPLSAYVDFNSRKRSGATTTVLGFGVQTPLKLGGLQDKEMWGGKAYSFAGAGIYTIKTRNLSAKSNLGVKVGVGSEKQDGMFYEVDYTFLSKVNSFNPSFIGIRVGKKF
jgi:hypothetical protein